MAKANKKNVKESKISGKMSFYELLQKYPHSGEILMKNGMSCVGCPMAMQESLEMGARAHGMDVKKLVDELNKKLAKGKKK